MKNSAIVRLGALCASRVSSAPRSPPPPPTRSHHDPARRRRAVLPQGRDLFEKLRATDARPLFEKAVAKDPSFALAHLGLANTAGSTKQFFDALNKAVAVADKASEPERLMVCNVDAGAKGEVARQKDCLTKLIAAYPADERAHNLMGGYYFGRQDWAAAAEEYKKATVINPDFSTPYNTLGYSLRFSEVREAEQAFKKYIALIPGDPNPYDSTPSCS